MATVKQSIQMYNGDNISIDQQSFTAMAIFLAKRFDVVQKAVTRLSKNDGIGNDSRGKDNDNVGDSKNSGDNGVKEIVDVLERMEKNLKSIDSNIEIIKQQTKAMDDYFKGQQKKEKQKEEVVSKQDGSSILVTKLASKSSKIGKPVEYLYDAVVVSTVGYAFAQMIQDFWARTGNDPVLNQQKKEATSEITISNTTEIEKQDKLEKALDNLSVGFNTWRTKNASTYDDKQARLEEILNNLSIGIKKWRVNKGIPTAYDKQKKLDERLNALANGVETWHSNRKDSVTGTMRRDSMVKSFKDTLTEMAIFLKTVFEEPVKSVEKQFLHMGVVAILVLRKMESEIDSVASALGSLQLAGATMVSSAQDTIAEAEKELQSIPSAEKSLGTPVNAEGSAPSTSTASKQSSISMQQNADAYEISSQKAGEINASTSNQSGARQTIINMSSNMPVNASIHNGMDMETFLRQLSQGMDMAMRSSAEGVHL